MKPSDAKIAANRRNPRKHSLLAASGFTELDDIRAYQTALRNLGKDPLGVLDSFFRKQIAFYMTKVRLGSRLEAEYLRSALHPIVTKSDQDLQALADPVIEPGIPASVSPQAMQCLLQIHQRYQTANENKLYRAIHEWERVRRIRQGEPVPAPAVVDLGVHHETPHVDADAAFPNVPFHSLQLEGVPSDHESSSEAAGTNDTGEDNQKSGESK